MNAISMNEARTIQTHLVLPPDTNHHGSIFGGKVLAYIDEIAGIASMKHAHGNTVTASIDSVDFLSSAYAGDVLELEAVVASTGCTSMEIYVRVNALNLVTGTTRLTTESFVTMVAIDENGKPREVASVYPETAADKRLFDTAPGRREHRKAKRALESHK